MSIEKEEQLLCKRFIELARTAQLQYRNTFTSFLNLNEINLFYQTKNNLPDVSYSMFGGFMNADRRMICFHGEEYEVETMALTKDRNEITLAYETMYSLYPIDCVRIRPVNKKFSDELTHRDVLGALMNLGIERAKIGDILLEENNAYVFCDRCICTYLMEHLMKVKHTTVSCDFIQAQGLQIEPKFTMVHGTVTSQRLDAIIATAFQKSRNSVTDYISGKRVFVNSKQELSNSYILKENDIVSVRGLGKFIYVGTTYQTKKGRFSVTIKRYSS